MTLLFGWAARLVGERFAKPVVWALLIGLVLLAVFALGRCGGDDPTPQVEQGNRSSEAVADAAQDAISTLEDRVATEQAIDRAVAAAVVKIDDAVTPDAVRDAVLESICGEASHRNDPACTTSAETRMVNPVTAEGLDM